jgi:hypothetical protein
MFKTRLTSGRALAIAVCVIGLSLIMASVVWAAVPTGFSITFNGTTSYDSGTNKTTFSYTVCSDGNQAHALSHWVLSLCVDENGDVMYSPGDCTATNGASCTVGKDGSTGMTGIKFDGAIGEGKVAECHTFTFTLSGDWRGRTANTLWTVKAGGDIGSDTTTGPDCSGGPTAVTLSSLAARSSAGGWASPLWLGLVGGMVLAAGSLFWVKRRGG